MAPSTPTASLTDHLVTCLLPKGTTAPQLRKHKDVFSRKLKGHTYARTNQFEVAEKLDLLQERFQILNQDELSDALHDRLVQLKQHSEKWLPDILDLMLQLSDDPANKTRIKSLDRIGAATTVVPSLTSDEIGILDHVDRKDPIWKVAEYSDFSSDDDIVVVKQKTSITEPKSGPHQEQESSPEITLEPLNLDDARKALDEIRQPQFWHNISDEPFELTEVQIVREVLFMLQGLPTFLFWKAGDHFEIDKRFGLGHANQDTTLDLLQDFASTSARLDTVRTFLRGSQSVRFMQTLCFELEKTMQDTNAQLRVLEQAVLAVEGDATVTLLQLSQRVSEIVQGTVPVTGFVEQLNLRSFNNPMKSLELLFDTTCQKQACGDEESYKILSRLFCSCFETYFKTVQDWMDEGRLTDQDETIFIRTLAHDRDPSGLWQKWYKLEGSSEAEYCPKFLQPFRTQIFNTGKTVIFLQRLDAFLDELHNLPDYSLERAIRASAHSLIPSSELFADSMQNFVDTRLRIVTSTLRDHLGSHCGLWKSLDALNHIYFARNGYVTDIIDTKVFASIDRCEKSWNDRFLIGDLLQNVFEPIGGVEVERLAVMPSINPSRNMPHRRRSVKLLRDLRIQYTLPWAVANVIRRLSLSTYQRISTLLAQVRRARFVLNRRCLLQVRTGRLDADSQERNLNLELHHNFLIFVNTIYDHLTSFVIDEANKILHGKLTNAIDIDAMIAAHTKYCKDLEDACLISKELKPIHDELIAVLDLCIRLSDLNTPTPTRLRSSDADAHSYVSATSQQLRRRRRERENPSSEEEEDDGGSDAEEGYSTFIIPEESDSLVQQLRKIKTEFKKQVTFLVAGLESIGRASEQGSNWEILAARLNWKRQ
jgi:gamma-tubulin complex component 5